jgi:hypothetical protein
MTLYTHENISVMLENISESHHPIGLVVKLL